jgi:hypothetical protein
MSGLWTININLKPTLTSAEFSFVALLVKKDLSRCILCFKFTVCSNPQTIQNSF